MYAIVYYKETLIRPLGAGLTGVGFRCNWAYCLHDIVSILLGTPAMEDCLGNAQQSTLDSKSFTPYFFIFAPLPFNFKKHTVWGYGFTDLKINTGSSISRSEMKSLVAIFVGPIQYIEIPLGAAFCFDDC